MLQSVLISEKDIEALPLLIDDLQVLPLRHRDVWRASKTWFDAFVDEPTDRYQFVHDMHKPNPVLRKLWYMAIISVWMETKTIFTVKGGAAVIIATLAPPKPSKPSHKIMLRLLGVFTRSLAKLQSAEAKQESEKRQRELNEKTSKAIKDALGELAKEMVYIDMLGTSPESQGHGYGGALVDNITHWADTHGRASYVFSTSVNFGFYGLHGFVPQYELSLGDENPEWHEEPIIISLMVREPYGMKLCETAARTLSKKS